jgi:hypothetical protein
MKPHLYGIIGIVLGLIACANGLRLKSEGGAILLLGGIFLFGCGLVAAAIGAKK